MKTFRVTIYCCFLLCASVVDATDCPDRWVAFEGSCYLFGHDLIHFTEAEQYCRQHSGRLVHVETKEENMFLRDFLRDFKCNVKNFHQFFSKPLFTGIYGVDSFSCVKCNKSLAVADYWIGMTDETVEDVWKWYGTDTLVEDFDWGPSEPQNAHNEDCAVFGDTIDYTWADVTCASNRKALCETLAEDMNEIIG